MDKIKKYSKTVREILEVLATRIPVNAPTLKKHLVIDDNKNEYILVSLGRHKDKYNYTILAHLEIKNGKIFIHEESVDPSIFERLTDKGIPESDILPVYLPDFVYD
jgi:XisI protein